MRTYLVLRYARVRACGSWIRRPSRLQEGAMVRWLVAVVLLVERSAFSAADGEDGSKAAPRDAITVANRAELLDFLGSAQFERDYFEKAPVLITIADSGWAHEEDSEPFTLRTLLDLPRWSYEAVCDAFLYPNHFSH